MTLEEDGYTTVVGIFSFNPLDTNDEGAWACLGDRSGFARVGSVIDWLKELGVWTGKNGGETSTTYINKGCPNPNRGNPNPIQS